MLGPIMADALTIPLRPTPSANKAGSRSVRMHISAEWWDAPRLEKQKRPPIEAALWERRKLAADVHWVAVFAISVALRHQPALMGNLPHAWRKIVAALLTMSEPIMADALTIPVRPIPSANRAGSSSFRMSSEWLTPGADSDVADRTSDLVL